MIRISLIISSLLLFSVIAMAQNKDKSEHESPQVRCGTENAMEELYHNHPESLIENEEFEQFTKRFVQNKSNAKGTLDQDYVIPVVFHILGSSYNYGTTVDLALVKKALISTNEDFQGLRSDWEDVDPDFKSIRGKLNITFKLAQLDPDGNPTTGVVFHAKTSGFGNITSAIETKIKAIAWDNYKYMNVYIMRDLYADGDNYNSGVSWYPSTSMSTDGLARVVYNGSYLATNTDDNFRSIFTHEFGHWLNLKHTFQGGCTYPNDFVSDTPPAETTHMGLCDNNKLNCEGKKTNGDNFMDYTDCYNMYSKGQVTRMQAALQHSARYPLWQHDNLVATGLLTSSSISDRNIQDATRIFPNPANKFLRIELDETQDLNNINISMINIVGVSVKIDIKHSGNAYNVDISNLNEGIYFLDINYGKQKVVKKVYIAR